MFLQSYSVTTMPRELLSAISVNIHAQCTAQRDYELAQAEVDKWERQYQVALQSEREYIIVEIKFRKDVCIKKAQELKMILNQKSQNLNNLRELIKNSNHLRFWFDSQGLIHCHKHDTDLEIRLRKFECELEATKAKLLAQKTEIEKLLKQNSLALENVKILLSQASSKESDELNSITLEIYKNEIEGDNIDIVNIK